jgi:hypothetical protein
MGVYIPCVSRDSCLVGVWGGRGVVFWVLGFGRRERGGKDKGARAGWRGKGGEGYINPDRNFRERHLANHEERRRSRFYLVMPHFMWA